MKVHRFIGSYDLRQAEIVLEDQAARQMALVLKMRAGERILLCNGQGKEAEYEILSIKKGAVRVARDGDITEVKTESARQVTLYASILKRENFELIVQKATECGVARIVPVISERTIKKDVKLERLQEIAREAAEQSGRGVVPPISEPMTLAQALKDAEVNGKNYFFDVSQAANAFKPSATGSAGLFIGPEGGWTEEEQAQAKRAGCAIATLGPRVLRGETACIAAVYLMTI